MTGPTAKGEATRQDILATATAIFAHRGYASTRMDDIIRATGLTKGAIYFHFRSKHALALAIVDEHKQRWLSLAGDEVAKHERPSEQLRALGGLLISLAVHEGGSWNVVRLAEEIRAESGEGYSLAPQADDGSRGPLHDWISLVGGILQAGQDGGEFDPALSATDTAVVIIAAFDGLKTTSDAIAPGELDLFRRRAELLLAMVEARIIPPRAAV